MQKLPPGSTRGFIYLEGPGDQADPINKEDKDGAVKKS